MKGICRLMWAMALVCALCASGIEVSLSGGGGLSLPDGPVWRVSLVDRSWVVHRQGEGDGKTFVEEPGGSDARRAFRFDMPGFARGRYEARLERAKKGQRYAVTVSLDEPASFASLGLDASFPVERWHGTVLQAGGTSIVLPREADPRGTLFDGQVSGLTFSGRQARYVLTGPFQLFVQDNRKFGGKDYLVRLRLKPGYGQLSEASLAVTVQTVELRGVPVELRGVANMGFADETDNDGQGGWTDQGRENDLRMLKPGVQVLGGIRFDIIAPEANGGRSCVMLCGGNVRRFPRSVEVPVADEVRGGCLYLLHALAWPGPQFVGVVTVTYADGTEERHECRWMREVDNWWSPKTHENGDVVWTGENGQAFVGLYATGLPLRSQAIRRIRLEAQGNTVWGVVAMSVLPQAVPRVKVDKYYVVAGEEFQPMPYHHEIEPGSVLDFSALLDAPAGRHGPVVCRNGQLEFRDVPGQPVRLYGTNLSGTANYLSHEWATAFAERAARMGFNLIRLHHHDNDLGNHGKDWWTFNQTRQDQLDFLIAELKRRGIYITTDLFVSRAIPPGAIPEHPGKGHLRKFDEFKAMVYILDSAYREWQRFSREFLTHVNPYTGLALKDDPVLATLNLVNEGNIDRQWQATDFSKSLYLKAYDAWRTERGLAEPDDEAARRRQFSRFLADTYARRYAQMREFVRGLGVQVPLSDQNMLDSPLLSVMRSHLDYVDNHTYWDGPFGTYLVPSGLGQRSAICEQSSVLNDMFLSRQFGKPFSVSEFDFCKPSRYRAEGPLLLASYGGLQGWSALCQFAYGHWDAPVMRQIAGNHFDIGSDCVKSLSHRLAAALFLRGEVRPLGTSLAAVVDADGELDSAQHHAGAFMRLGRLARVGTIVTHGQPAELPPRTLAVLDVTGRLKAADYAVPVLTEAEVPAFVRRQFGEGPEQGVWNAPGGQVFFDAKAHQFKVVTPSIEAFALAEGSADAGAFARVETVQGRAVVAIVSHDGRPLAESRRMLVLHLTDTLPLLARFSSRERKLWETWGKRETMAERGVVRLTLPRGRYRLRALDTAGRPIGDVPVAPDGVAQLSVINAFGQTMQYELTLEPSLK